MRFSTTLAPLSLLGLALAQNNSTNTTNVVTIQVGATAATPNGGIFQFIPNNVTATNGTVINFKFLGMPGNHSVTQSTFANPCVPVDGGFDSGWVFLPTAGLTPVPEWNLTITDDSKPIWFFCKQLIPAPHCTVGMVGSINAPTTGNTLDAYKQNAKSVTNVPQNENGLVGVGGSASARPGPIPSGAKAFPDISGASNAPAPTSSGGAGGSGGSGSSGAVGLSVSSAMLVLMAAVSGTLLA